MTTKGYLLPILAGRVGIDLILQMLCVQMKRWEIVLQRREQEKSNFKYGQLALLQLEIASQILCEKH